MRDAIMEAYGDEYRTGPGGYGPVNQPKLEEFKNIGYGTPEEWMNTMDRL